jgi:hypothetical protein
LLKHERFEELAAVGAHGELSPDETRELNLHLADCHHCRAIYDDYEELHAPLRPLLDPEMETIIESRRDRVKAAVLNAIAIAEPQILIHERPNHRSGIFATRPNAFRPLWLGLAAAMVASIVFWLGIHYERRVVNASEQARHVGVIDSIQHLTPATSADSERDAQDELSNAQYTQLVNDLQAEKRRSATLGAALSARDKELMESESERLLLQQRLDTETEEARITQSLLDAKAEELNQMEAAKSNQSTAVLALQYQVQELTEKLNDQKQSLDRERQLLASGRDIRDIVGARNLHIIDVYDTGPEGNTRKAFARAFYTEGKSLIFYAYDLPARRTEDGKFVYAAWGERNGNKRTIRNLGILLNDDTGQRRWVLNFSDPKVLAEIDSVFITLERAGVDGEEPSGKRMLTAYLNSRVNHP